MSAAAERAAARFGKPGDPGCCETCGSRSPDDRPDIEETTIDGTNMVSCPDAFHKEISICENCRSPIFEGQEIHLIYGADWCSSCADNQG